MACRLALTLALLMAAPVSAQDRELEAGAGMWFVNPLRVVDFEHSSTPSANAAWTNWYSERSGWNIGALALPSYDGSAAFFGHVTWRRRWLHDGEGNFTHLGFGAGPTIWRYDYPCETREPSWTFRSCGTWRRSRHAASGTGCRCAPVSPLHPSCTYRSSCSPS